MSRRDGSDMVVLILSALVFLGAGLGAFLSWSGEKELREKIRKEEEAVASGQEKVDKVGALLDGFSLPLGWRSRPKSGLGTTQKDPVRKQLDAWADILNARLGSAKYAHWGSIGNPLHIKEAIEEQEKLADGFVAEAKAEQEKAKASRAEEEAIIGLRDRKSNAIVQKGSLLEMIDSKDAEIAQVQQEREALRQTLIQEARDKGGELQALTQELQGKRGEQDAESAEFRKAEAAVQAQVGELKTRIDQFQQHVQVGQTDAEPDGSVLKVDREGLVAWVDLGRRDGALKGTRFEIWHMLKGATRVKRGLAEILDIYDDFCKVALTLEKSGEPVEEGDVLANETFQRKKARIIAFAGRLLGKYTNEEIVHKISERGGIVRPEVGADTSYLVIGSGYEKERNYERANALGIKVIREKDLYDFFQIR